MKKSFLRAAIPGGLFLLLLIALRFDRAPIDAVGGAVGLSGLNGGIFSLLGVHPAIYTLTELMGYVTLAAAGAVALVGGLQFLQRRSLKAVDSEILFTGILYALTIALYVFFDKVTVNCRPAFAPGELTAESSFPSSHTLLAVTVWGSVRALAARYLPGQRFTEPLRLFALVFPGLLIFLRLFAGVHWFTDILAGVLLGAALLELWQSALSLGAAGKHFRR